MEMLRPAPDFDHKIARAGLDKGDLARNAGVSKAALFGWLNPGTQPNRKGGIRLKTAWALARAYAAAAKVSDEEAYAALFVEVPDE